MIKILVLFYLFSLTNVAFSQQLSYTDAPTAFNRLQLEKWNSNMYQQIGTFKVIGDPCLFGPKLKGNVYALKEKAENTVVSYNTYFQQLEVYQDNSDLPLIKKNNEIDSFMLFTSLKADMDADLHFINSRLADSSSKKGFLQVVFTGERFSLYKAYKSELGYVSTNYVDSYLRQFDLVFDYYYTDAAKPGLKKLKVSAKNLKNEFKAIKDVSSIADSDMLNTKPEKALVQIFSLLNLK